MLKTKTGLEKATEGEELVGNKDVCHLLVFCMINSIVIFHVLFTVTGTFSCTRKFLVKDCDPNTGEPDDDGYEDEYVVS